MTKKGAVRIERKSSVEEEERFASLKLMAALSGVEVKVKPICQDWILLTFDLPTTDEGNKLRSEFYKKARYLGATMHSESCYMVPWCPESELLAIKLTETGNCYIWVSTIKNEGVAKELTEKYDKDVSDNILKELWERITKTKKHAEEGEEGIVDRMHEKTSKMIAGAAGIAARRGSEKLAKQVERLKTEFEEIEVSSSAWVNELKALL